MSKIVLFVKENVNFELESSFPVYIVSIFFADVETAYY